MYNALPLIHLCYECTCNVIILLWPLYTGGDPFQLLLLLLKNYIIIVQSIVSGNTGLHYAASNGFSEGYYCLVQHGASATSQLDSDNGMSPLDVARKHGKFNAIKKAGIVIIIVSYS